MDALNRAALELVDEALDFAEDLRIGAHELSNGATVLDFGVEFRGGLEAGLMLTEIQTAGLATVQTRMDTIGRATVPRVELSTDHPELALLGSQHAGWAFEEAEALGSGPARAMVAADAVYEQLAYREDFDFAILSLESHELPDADLADHIADQTGVNPEALYLPTAPTGSLAGSVAGAARAAELVMTRLVDLGYPTDAVLVAAGSAPVAPATRDESLAIARNTDALCFGGEVHLTVEEDHEALADCASSAASELNGPLATQDVSMEDLPAGVFAPATVTVDVVDGPRYVSGNVSEDHLETSFQAG